jgi:hypothetical protein
VSVQYATASELASYIQSDVDTSTAVLLLQLASAEFNREADTSFTPITATWSEAGNGGLVMIVPWRPITAVTAVRIAGTTVTDYSRIEQRFYRTGGWGSPWAFPPDLIEIDLTYGYATVPDEVKAAVLETAAQAYQQPASTIAAESIDDYRVRYNANTGGVQLSASAMKLAADIRGQFLA